MRMYVNSTELGEICERGRKRVKSGSAQKEIYQLVNNSHPRDPGTKKRNLGHPTLLMVRDSGPPIPPAPPYFRA